MLIWGRMSNVLERGRVICYVEGKEDFVMKTSAVKQYAKAIGRSFLSPKPFAIAETLAVIALGAYQVAPEHQSVYIWACVAVIILLICMSMVMNIMQIKREPVASSEPSLNHHTGKTGKKLFWWSLCIILFFALCAVVAYQLYNHYAPTVKYYEDYVEKDNRIVGLRQLDSDARAQRACFYKLTFKKGECCLLERVGSDDSVPKYLMPWELLRPGRIEVVFDASGKVVSHKKTYDSSDSRIIWEFAGNDKVRFSQEDGKPYVGVALPLEHFTGVLGDPGIVLVDRNEKSAYKATAYWGVTRKDGLITEVLFKDANNAVTCNEDGAKGYVFKYDEMGRVIEVSLKGKDKTEAGVAKVQYVYGNKDNRLSAIRYLNEKNKLKNSKFGFARMEIAWKNGNVESFSYFDENDNKYSGFNDMHAIKFSYNAKGFVTEITCHDVDHNLHRSRSAKFARSVFHWGDNDKLLTLEYKDENNQFCISLEGYAKKTLEYDSQNNLIKECYYKDEVTLVDNNMGYAIALYKYIGGEKVEIQYRNANNELTMTKHGYASIKWVTGDNSLGEAKTVKEWYGSTNYIFKAIFKNRKTEEIYDAQQRLIRTTSLDENNKPIENNDGYVYSLYEYLSGDVIKIYYLDENKVPVLTNDGYHIMQEEPEGDFALRRTYYDLSGNPCSTTDGYFSCRVSLLRNGEAEEKWQFYDEQGKPCRLIETGAQSCTYSLKTGSVVGIYYMDSAGELVATQPFGYAGSRFEPVGDEQVIIKHYGCDRVSTDLTPSGTPVEKFKIDHKGRVVEVSFSDVRGRDLCMNRENFARKSFVYDDELRTETMCYFDAEDNPCVNKMGCGIVKERKDRADRVVAVDYCDINGNAVKNKDGIAGVRNKYNEDGEVIQRTYVDERGDVMDSPAYGYAFFVKSCFETETGEKTETIYYYMADGKKRASDKGIAGEKIYYDSQKRVIRRENYDRNGQLLNDEHGVASSHRQYDGEGNYVEYYTDASGREVPNKRGIFRVNAEKQQCGFFKESYADSQGNACAHPDGYFFCRVRFSADETIEETYFYDRDGRACAVGEEHAEGVKHFYDEEGNTLHSIFLDASGQIKDTVMGYAILDYEYDWLAMKRRTSYRASNYYGCTNVKGEEYVEHQLLPGGGIGEKEPLSGEDGGKGAEAGGESTSAVTGLSKNESGVEARLLVLQQF